MLCSKPTGLDRPIRLMRLLRALLYGCVLNLAGWPQAHAQFTRFENFTDEQGLGNVSVSALAQDRTGYVLLGTEAGLYRYDGVGLSPVAASAGLPPDAWIRTVIVDGRGWVWVVTTDTVYLRRTDHFSAVDAGSGLRLLSPHLVARLDASLVIDNGGTLIHAAVDERGVHRFSPLLDAATLKATPILSAVRFVVADGPHALLLGCGSGICRVEGGRPVVLGTKQGLPADSWQVAMRTPDGTLWARSLDRLAWRAPGDAVFQVVEVPGRRGHFNAAVPSRLDLVDDRRGGVLTQGEEGLLDFDGKSWRAFRHHEGGLSASPVQSMMFDREGSLWVGSIGHGVFRSLGWATWEHWTAEDGLPSDIVWSMTRPAGGPLWVATWGDAVPLDGRAPGVPGGSENVSVTRSGRLWFAPLRAPLARLDRVTRRIDRVPITGIVASTFLDPANRFWVATDKGLLLIADADADAERLKATVALAGPTLQAVSDVSGRVWAVRTDGLYRRGGDGRFERVNVALPAGQRTQGLAFASNGDLWVMTDSAGISRFRLTEGRPQPLASVSTPEIGSNNILFVYRDRRGWMWVGTDHGVDLFDGQSWRHFSLSDGLISNDLDQSAIYEDLDGSMWFGTSRGLSHLVDPLHLPKVEPLHPLVTRISMGSRRLTQSKSVRADWTSAPLVIRFVDLDFSRGRNITFRYRLGGVDAGWNDTTAHEVRYASLPASKLRFELVAIDAAHGAVSAPVGFTLRLRAPWWRRWWFYGLCVMLAGSTIAATWQARVRLLVRQRRRLEALVRVRTAEIEQARTELHRLAMSDALTGLPNRRAIMSVLEETVATALASNKPLAAMLCDIDHFKRINDGFGHLAGDAVLSEFGGRLKSRLREGEAAGRYGGEEFCVLLPGGPELVAERVGAIRSAVSDAPYPLSNVNHTVTSSGGLAFLRDGDTALSLLARADAALYRAKRKGRNRVEYELSHPEEADDATDALPKSPSSQRAELERDLRTALAKSQFALDYQPVVDVRQGVVTSCEALLRWNSPARGRVSPAEFIPFAEQVGLMPEISDWVLRTACREAASWQDRIGVSVNLSAVQFREPDLVSKVEAALAQSGLHPGRLELEVTETAMITEAAAASVILEQLRSRGIKIALDDFGTGYSSLSFLRTLPFDRIKIDRSFVQDLGLKSEALVIVRAIAGICESLGAAVTAEGVETDAQMEALRMVGCTELQGYRIGRPCPPTELRTFIKSHAARWSPAAPVATPRAGRPLETAEHEYFCSEVVAD